MIDAAMLARVRADVAAGLDPSAMLSLYADPARRLMLRERVRGAVPPDTSDGALDTLCAELFGFGVLQPLLDDGDVTDVLVNGPAQIFVERSGRLERVDVRFRDTAQVSELAHRIAAGVGRELTIERPYVDARMRDGSRANAVIAPVGGPTVSIRKFKRVSLPLRGPAPSWEASGLADCAADLLARAVVARANVLIVGSTGVGKSTFLRSLSGEIPAEERLVVIEDTNELVLPHDNVVHLECVPGRDGGIGVADLVVNALRMRPDRIIVGEVRSPREASALLEAISTGHDGSLTSLHAGSVVGALDRLELLLARSGDVAPTAISRFVARSFDVVVHIARTREGLRRVREIAAVEEHGPVALWRAGDAELAPPPGRLSQRLS
ncbi:MAG TPA: ATPase, T2SS/T4P/T4SS family [Candidatus Limnocylindria bacterium]|nr:ATPase, T2SS/T4P/T4SS family [Candidatus Limnocylindria bacterium]